MARTITVLHTPGCPNIALVRQRLDEALVQLPGPSPRVIVEEITDIDEAARRRFHGSPTVTVDGVDPFADPTALPAIACRTYRTDAGIEGAPSVGQLVVALGTSQGGRAVATSLHRDDVGRLAAGGAQLLEVLPAAEYDEEHLPGALSIPLKALAPDTVAKLDPSRPVIVYCWDAL